MLAKVEDSMWDNLSLPDEEIILNGPPEHLVGNVVMHNRNTATLRIKGIQLLAVKRSKAGETATEFTPNLRFNSRLEAGEQRLEHVSLSMPYNTPPGTYDKYMMVGGDKRKVKMIIQPTIKIALHPSHFTFQGSAPDTLHTASITVTNLGNLPFQIPKISHVAALDMDYLCRALGFAFRENQKEGLTDTLDRAVQNIKENLMNWANAKLNEAGKILEPGASLVVNLEIKLPKNAKANDDYSGTVRFWDKDLSFVVKSHTNAVKSRKDAK